MAYRKQLRYLVLVLVVCRHIAIEISSRAKLVSASLLRKADLNRSPFSTLPLRRENVNLTRPKSS